MIRSLSYRGAHWQTLALITNIRLGRTGLTRTNTCIHTYIHTYINANYKEYDLLCVFVSEKSWITLAPEINVIKLFLFVPTNCVKPEIRVVISMPSISSTVKLGQTCPRRQLLKGSPYGQATLVPGKYHTGLEWLTKDKEYNLFCLFVTEKSERLNKISYSLCL